MRQLLCALAAALMFSGTALAATKAADRVPDFPPGLFTDGRHYSLNDLDGKAVVLFFYEQNCPKCRGLIPARNEIVEKYRDKPVRFIAIAAGDSMTEAKAYIASTKLAMPVFADNLSVMESLYGMKISMNNIYQFRVIGPTGKLEEYRMEPEAIDKVLEHTKWKYKNGGYDAKLDGAVEAFEWGQYADGLRTLKPFLKNSKKEVVESAKKLYGVIRAEGEQWLASAEAAVAGENPVEGFDLYTKVANAFAGEDLGKKAADALKKLAATQAVKDELAARQMYEQLCNGAARATIQQRQAVGEFAATIIKKYPKTPTAEKLTKVVEELARPRPQD